MHTKTWLATLRLQARPPRALILDNQRRRRSGWPGGISGAPPGELRTMRGRSKGMRRISKHVWLISEPVLLPQRVEQATPDDVERTQGSD